MKNIFYCSNAQSDIFPCNSRSKFDNYIDINHLNYLPSHGIEAAIKSITFDNRRDEKLLKEQVIGVRSNISEFSIKNGEYDKIVSLFLAGKISDVIHIDFKNPIFFCTQKELLSRAHFELIDTETNCAPNFMTGAPTYIQVVIRRKIREMKKPFAIFLDSSCKKSKDLYTNNNSMDFTIKLPERLEFRRDWNVVLKSLFLPNNIQNVPECFMFYWQGRPLDSGGFEVLQKVNLKLKEGNYLTIDNILTHLSKQISEAKLPITIELHDGKVKISCPTYLQSGTVISITMSQDLAPILGFTKPLEKFHGFNLTEYDFHIAPHEPYIPYPRNLIIGCDIVSDTIFGGEHVKFLRLVANPVNTSSEILSFDFLQNEYVDLGVKNFDTIRIRIADVDGKTIKSLSDTPSRLQLMFVNI